MGWCVYTYWGKGVGLWAIVEVVFTCGVVYCDDVMPNYIRKR